MTRNHSRGLSWKGAAVVGLASLVMAGCQWFNGKESKADEMVWCTVEYDDSITVDGAKAFQEMRIDFPPSQDLDKADKGTVAALGWICSQVAACCYPNYENEPLDSTIKFSIDEVEMAVVSTEQDFYRLLPKCHEASLLVFDGLCRQPAVWQRIKMEPAVTVTFDLYYCGIALFDPKRAKQHYKVNF